MAVISIAQLCGCSSLTTVSTGQALIGQPAAAVEARMGQPAERYDRAAGGTRWLYPTHPLGEYTYAADFDNDGHLSSFRQILTTQDFSKIQINRSTQEDVLQTFGKPEQISYFPATDRRVWTYRFRKEGVWPAFMHVSFDQNGVVRLTQIIRDPRYDYGG